MRDLQLVLKAAGGAELIDAETDATLWASDSDEDFAEEFPEVVDENDLEHLIDYLEEHELATDRELEAMECLYEPLEGLGPDDDEGDEDEDGNEWDPDGGGDDDDDIVDVDFQEIG